MKLSSRQESILTILLRQDAYRSISHIAEQLNISKRTVQREFASLDRILSEYGLALDSKSGAGVRITGSAQARQELARTLTDKSCFDASEKRERVRALIFALLSAHKLEKLSYYSERFYVSDATVSNDLSSAEQWLERCDLHVSRRSGVTLEGTESAHRNAVQRFLEQYSSDEERQALYQGNPPAGDTPLVDAETIQTVRSALAAIDLSCLTDESYRSFLLYLSISVFRMRQGCFIHDATQVRDSEAGYELVQSIAQTLEQHVSITIPTAERVDWLLHLGGAKRQLFQPDTFKETRILDLVDRMLDVFPPERAALLKCDEDFMQGLVCHLKPTLVRLQNHLNIYNPLLDSIKREYSDLYDISRRAAQILERETGFPVSEDEIGYLTMHFGAALLQYESGGAQRRKVRIGILCSSGIGLARLMENKLQHIFSADAVFSTYAREDVSPALIAQHDFFVSALSGTPLVADCIEVSPLITKLDIQHIRTAIDRYAVVPNRVGASDFTQQLDAIHALSMQIKHVLQCFCVTHTPADLSFPGLLRRIAQTYAQNEDMERQIVKDLTARESLSSQLFPVMHLALLHCRTIGVHQPIFSVFVPDGACFTDAYFQGIRSAVVMMIPKDTGVAVNTALMGHLSSSLIQSPGFLHAIIEGDEQAVSAHLEQLLRQFFRSFCKQ